MSLPKVVSVLAEVEQEREKQDKKWGPQNHLDIRPTSVGDLPGKWMACRYAGIPSAGDAKNACEDDKTNKETNWSSIMVEEVSEAVEEAGVVNSEGLRAELIQVAAVAVAWVEDIDRRKKAVSPALPYTEPDKDAS